MTADKTSIWRTHDALKDVLDNLSGRSKKSRIKVSHEVADYIKAQPFYRNPSLLEQVNGFTITPVLRGKKVK